MKYIARALAPGTSGLRPVAPSTSPLARLDQRWNLPVFSGQPRAAGFAEDDDGFVSVAEVPVQDAARDGELHRATQRPVPSAARAPTAARGAGVAVHTALGSGPASTALLPSPGGPLDALTMTLNSERNAVLSPRPAPSSQPSVAPSPSSMPRLPGTPSSEPNARVAPEGDQSETFARVAAWLAAPPTQPATAAVTSGLDARSASANSQPVVKTMTLEIGRIEIEIVPSDPPKAKAAATDSGRARPERWPAPFGGRQF